MLASLVVPPFERSLSPHLQAPVATFFNIPRRYVRSNMQIGDTPSRSPPDDTKPARRLRKSTRLHDARSTPTSNPYTKEEDHSSPTMTSPQLAKKRLATLQEVINGEDAVYNNSSSMDLQSPQSATSNASGDLSPQVCLCQPEPKIPRPRNGKSFRSVSLCSASFSPMWVV